MAASIDARVPLLGPLLVVLGAILLQLTLADKITVGPRWLLPGLEGLLLIGLAIATPMDQVQHKTRRMLALVLIGLVSVANIVSLALLVHYLLHGGKGGGRALIGSGVELWVTNVLVFGLWYWELDRGGPLARQLRREALPDFLFPQMGEGKPYVAEGWMPGLVDYLYTSFTNATAFSPTDTMPLTATAKWLMTVQSLTALVTIGLVVARAVNILS
ncbi:MAG: hypothetical protein JOZ98_17210 [Solirubrobacterales bacterium]|nr:hypothetical protein [Solirubrobacterales bacterium]MBV9797146.1 hypothetical protein [Solirubrobacterales bacterium]